MDGRNPFGMSKLGLDLVNGNGNETNSKGDVIGMLLANGILCGG